MNHDLLFFCTICRDKTEEDVARRNCTIEHSVRKYRKGEYIAYQNDKIAYLYMLGLPTFTCRKS